MKTNQSTHTPGPWLDTTRGPEAGSCRVIEGTPTPTVDTAKFFNGEYVIAKLYGPQREANAALIAAAPELLTALKGCMSALEAIHDVAPAATSRAQRLATGRAAIAKAEGKA